MGRRARLLSRLNVISSACKRLLGVAPSHALDLRESCGNLRWTLAQSASGHIDRCMNAQIPRAATASAPEVRAMSSAVSTPQDCGTAFETADKKRAGRKLCAEERVVDSKSRSNKEDEPSVYPGALMFSPFTNVNRRCVEESNRRNDDVPSTRRTIVCSNDAAALQREFRIALWALRDAAARVVQEEVRHYARKTRALRESKESSDAAAMVTPGVTAEIRQTKQRETCTRSPRPTESQKESSEIKPSCLTVPYVGDGQRVFTAPTTACCGTATRVDFAPRSAPIASAAAGMTSDRCALQSHDASAQAPASRGGAKLEGTHDRETDGRHDNGGARERFTSDGRAYSPQCPRGLPMPSILPSEERKKRWAWSLGPPPKYDFVSHLL